MVVNTFLIDVTLKSILICVCLLSFLRGGVMVFYSTFNNISVIIQDRKSIMKMIEM